MLCRSQRRDSAFDETADIAGARPALKPAGAGANGVEAWYRAAGFVKRARVLVDADTAHGVGNARDDRQGMERRLPDRPGLVAIG